MQMMVRIRQTALSGAASTLLALLTLVAACQLASALDAPPTEPAGDAATSTESPNGVLRSLDAGQKAISETVIKTANRIDRFFGSDRTYQETQGSYLRASIARSQQEGEGSDQQFNLYGKLALPGTEDRLKLVFESDKDTGEQDTHPDTSEPRHPVLGLRYIPIDRDDWRFQMGSGVRFHSGPDLYVRARLRKLIPGRVWNTRLSQSIANYESSGREAISRAEFERTITENTFLRAVSDATWTDDTNAFELRDFFALVHTPTPSSMIQYRIGTRGITQPTAQVIEHYVSVEYRRQLGTDWLFLDVAPKIGFPRENGFGPTKSIVIRIDALFGDGE